MNRLKELRASKNLTQADMSRILGITQSGYSRWESGQVKIDNVSLQKIAKYFNVSIDYIMYNNLSNRFVTNEDDLGAMFKSLNNAEKLKVKGYMQGLMDSRPNNNGHNDT